MTLDFTTLYVLILLNSIGFAIVWAAISLSYRTLQAPRYWFASLALSCMSGPALLFGETIPLLTYTGTLLLAASFSLIWQGLRVFFGQRPLWGATALILALTAVALVAFGNDRAALNVITAASQLVSVSLSVHALLRRNNLRIGNWVAAAACSIVLAGQGAEAATNVMRLAGVMPSETYHAFSAWFLVAAILGGSLWNLGFLLLVIDRLRSELRALAQKDELTGLPNRRGLNEHLMLFRNHGRTADKGLIVMMVDLDNFKTINDQFGHDAGDEALRHAASVLRHTIRAHDFVARLGGDEFCILLKDTSLSHATETARALTELLASRPFLHNGEQVVLSASIGIAAWDPNSETDLDDALRAADAALLKTKRDGRNGVTAFPVTSAVA